LKLPRVLDLLHSKVQNPKLKVQSEKGGQSFFQRMRACSEAGFRADCAITPVAYQAKYANLYRFFR
jgi:hypothetical protein